MSQYFIYTRTKLVDYRTLVSPSADYCPKEIRKEFLYEIRGVIDVDVYTDNFTSDTRHWLYSKKGDYVLFGLGILNSELGDKFNDYAGRPVRGFYGVISKLSADNDVRYTADLNFYRNLYKTLIEPIWELDREEYKPISKEVDYSQQNIEFLEPCDHGIGLNTKKGVCAVLGSVSPSDALSEAIYLNHDLSLVTGFNDLSHAYAEDVNYKFLNAIVSGVTERSERTLRTEHTEKPEEETHKERFTEEVTEDKPKKSYRLKLIVASAVVLIAMALIIGRCGNDPARDQSQKNCVSGEAQQQKKDSLLTCSQNKDNPSKNGVAKDSTNTKH